MPCKQKNKKARYRNNHNSHWWWQPMVHKLCSQVKHAAPTNVGRSVHSEQFAECYCYQNKNPQFRLISKEQKTPYLSKKHSRSLTYAFGIRVELKRCARYRCTDARYWPGTNSRYMSQLGLHFLQLDCPKATDNSILPTDMSWKKLPFGHPWYRSFLDSWGKQIGEG